MRLSLLLYYMLGSLAGSYAYASQTSGVLTPTQQHDPFTEEEPFPGDRITQPTLMQLLTENEQLKKVLADTLNARTKDYEQFKTKEQQLIAQNNLLTQENRQLSQQALVALVRTQQQCLIALNSTLKKMQKQPASSTPALPPLTEK